MPREPDEGESNFDDILESLRLKKKKQKQSKALMEHSFSRENRMRN